MLKSKIDRFLRLSRSERRLLIEALVCLGLARLLLRTLPFRRILAWTDSLQKIRPITGSREPEGLARMVRAAARHTPWRSLCLEQAMAGRVMLRRRGYSSRLHLGVGKSGETLEAHAWLECDGEILLGGEVVERFTPLAEFGETTP